MTAFHFENKANKGRPNGYADLDADGKVPEARLPDIEGELQSVIDQFADHGYGYYNGDFDSDITYAIGDVVKYLGSCYFAVQATNTTPADNPDAWVLLNTITYPLVISFNQYRPDDEAVRAPLGTLGLVKGFSDDATPIPEGQIWVKSGSGDADWEKMVGTGGTGATGVQGDPGESGATGATGPAGRFSGSFASAAAPIPLGKLAVWLDIADRSSLTLSGFSGHNCTAIADRSGNAIDFTQGTAAPVLNIASSVSMLDSLFVDGGQSAYHPTKANTNFLHNNKASVFIVAHPVGNGEMLTSRQGLGVGDHGFRIRIGSNDCNVLATNGGASLTFDSGIVSAPVVGPTVYTFLTDATASISDRVEVFVNGVDGGVTNIANGTAWTGDSDFPLYLFGAIGLGIDTPYAGRLYEIIIYDRIVSPAERVQIEKYLTRKWLQATKMVPYVDPASVTTAQLGQALIDLGLMASS